LLSRTLLQPVRQTVRQTERQTGYSANQPNNDSRFYTPCLDETKRGLHLSLGVGFSLCDRDRGEQLEQSRGEQPEQRGEQLEQRREEESS
jgi:hypothetical protein